MPTDHFGQGPRTSAERMRAGDPCTAGAPGTARRHQRAVRPAGRFRATCRDEPEAAHSIALGDNSVTVTGAVVARDVPADVVAVGDPARGL